MTLEQLQQWAQSRIGNTAQPVVCPEVGVSVLQLVDELEQLKEHVKPLEVELSVRSKAS